METILKSLNENITKEAIYHNPQSNYSYGYDKDTLHLRIRTKKHDIKKASLRIGDPYIWEKGGCDGGNMNAAGAKWSGVTINMKKEVETEYFDYWIAEFKPPKKRSRYAFILEGKTETLLFTEKRILNLDRNNDEEKLNRISDFFCFPYLNNIDVEKVPKWVKDTVWYQIFPDRFYNGDKSIDPEYVMPWGTEPTGSNFMGGDLRGIIEKLDYFVDLGINGLYFCPIFNATKNHRYDTIDYMEIDPRLGTKEDFHELVEKAHKRGIKIMLDAVFNHLGYFSKEWQDVIKNGENSKFKDWFHINKFPVVDRPLEKLDGRNLNYETFGRTAAMPKLNTENEEVVTHLLNVAEYWSKEMKIDAWRLDVSNEVDHVFWRKFRERVLKVNPDSFILGEIWHDALPWLMGDQFDSVMNYPLGDAIRDYFIVNYVDSESFKYMVNQISVNYPRQVMEAIFNLLDSHDTPRILTLAKGNKEKVKLALAFMFTQVGTPCIYYGTEISMEGNQGGGQEFHRRCMVWEEDKRDNDMYEFTKRLISIKKEYKQFNKIEIEWIKAEKDSNTLIYRKGDITIIMNNSNESIKENLPKDMKNISFNELISNTEVYLEEKIELKPYEVMMFI